MTSNATGQLWIFGYGSLVWRPDFPYAERRRARVSGYARRFWQSSTDHRGTERQPGRVATLANVAGSECVGVAYRVMPTAAAEVMTYLDRREKNGYCRRQLSVLLDDGTRRDAITYFAEAGSEHYLGPAPLMAMAEQIAASRGPSGTNTEYVLRLAAALRELGCERDEVFELERRLVSRSASGSKPLSPASAADEDAEVEAGPGEQQVVGDDPVPGADVQRGEESGESGGDIEVRQALVE